MSGEKVLFSIGHIKHPQGIAKQKTYVQITPADGIIHSDKVMAAFNHMQAGAEKMGCTFRGCDSEDGDPFKATRFTNVPCTDDQLRVAKRALYRVICKYPASVADAFGVNSARHWMVEIMLSRGTPVEHLVQAGLWSDHAMKGVHPQARSVGDRQKLLSTLPLEYAHNARVLYVVDVKLVEMQAVREYVKRIDAKALPTDEAWSHFRRNVQRHPLAPPLPAIPLPAERQRMEDDRMRELLQAAIWEEGGEGVSG
jgi:hypothetical protein